MFGQPKPSLILEIEHRLWNTIIDLAKDKHQMVVRVTHTLTEINTLVRSANIETISDWFSGEYHLC